MVGDHMRRFLGKAATGLLISFLIMLGAAAVVIGLAIKVLFLGAVMMALASPIILIAWLLS
jgi:hypothetical protein